VLVNGNAKFAPPTPDGFEFPAYIVSDTRNNSTRQRVDRQAEIVVGGLNIGDRSCQITIRRSTKPFAKSPIFSPPPTCGSGSEARRRQGMNCIGPRTVKTLLLLTLLLVPAWPAARPDPALVKTLQDKVASQDRIINGLRAQLDESRNQADGRVQAVKVGLESLNKTLQSQLDQARTETNAARTVGAGNDVLIRELTEQLDQTRRSDPSKAVVAAVQDAAVRTAVRVAAVRHAQEAADIKAGVSLAGAAAANSQQSKQLGQANSQELFKASREISRLTGIVQANSLTEMLGWRLMVILGAVVLAQTVVTAAIFWKIFHIIRKESSLRCL